MTHRYFGIIDSPSSFAHKTRQEHLKKRLMSTLFMIESFSNKKLIDSKEGLELRKKVLSIANDITRIRDVD